MPLKMANSVSLFLEFRSNLSAGGLRREFTSISRFFRGVLGGSEFMELIGLGRAVGGCHWQPVRRGWWWEGGCGFLASGGEAVRASLGIVGGWSCECPSRSWGERGWEVRCNTAGVPSALRFFSAGFTRWVVIRFLRVGKFLRESRCEGCGFGRDRGHRRRSIGTQVDGALVSRQWARSREVERNPRLSQTVSVAVEFRGSRRDRPRCRRGIRPGFPMTARLWPGLSRPEPCGHRESLSVSVAARGESRSEPGGVGNLVMVVVAARGSRGRTAPRSRAVICDLVIVVGASQAGSRQGSCGDGQFAHRESYGHRQFPHRGGGCSRGIETGVVRSRAIA
jgi:hypothetical protein